MAVVRTNELEACDQPPPANVTELPPPTLHFLPPVLQACPHRECVGRQLPGLHDLHDRERGRARDGVATPGTGELPWSRALKDAARPEQGRAGNSAAQPLGKAEHLRAHALPLDGVHLPRAPEAGLRFAVNDQEELALAAGNRGVRLTLPAQETMVSASKRPSARAVAGRSQEPHQLAIPQSVSLTPTAEVELPRIVIHDPLDA